MPSPVRPPYQCPSVFRGSSELTPREREVLGHICYGDGTKEIARSLRISPRTVEIHRRECIKKTGARNVADMVRIVFSPVYPSGRRRPGGKLKVSLCRECVYKPDDLGHLYDPIARHYCCITCPHAPGNA